MGIFHPTNSKVGNENTDNQNKSVGNENRESQNVSIIITENGQLIAGRNPSARRPSMMGDPLFLKRN